MTGAPLSLFAAAVSLPLVYAGSLFEPELLRACAALSALGRTTSVPNLVAVAYAAPVLSLADGVCLVYAYFHLYCRELFMAEKDAFILFPLP